jgi:hypothetical protein
LLRASDKLAADFQNAEKHQMYLKIAYTNFKTYTSRKEKSASMNCGMPVD